MVFGRAYSDISETLKIPSTELIFQQIKTRVTDLYKSDSQGIYSCISEETDGMEDEAVVWYVGSEHESASSEHETENWDCEDNEAEKKIRMAKGISMA